MTPDVRVLRVQPGGGVSARDDTAKRSLCKASCATSRPASASTTRSPRMPVSWIDKVEKGVRASSSPTEAKGFGSFGGLGGAEADEELNPFDEASFAELPQARTTNNLCRRLRKDAQDDGDSRKGLATRCCRFADRAHSVAARELRRWTAATHSRSMALRQMKREDEESRRAPPDRGDIHLQRA
jgi:hypothetical protein